MTKEELARKLLEWLAESDTNVFYGYQRADDVDYTEVIIDGCFDLVKLAEKILAELQAAPKDGPRE